MLGPKSTVWLRGALAHVTCAALAWMALPVAQAAALASEDVGITKTGGRPTELGGTVLFTLSGVNNGPLAAPPGSVTITDPLPPGFALVSATGTGWSCGSPQLTCVYNGAVPVGGSFPPIAVTLRADTTGQFRNCAHIAYKGRLPETDMHNNDSCVPFSVSKPVKVRDLKFLLERNVGTIGDFTEHRSTGMIFWHRPNIVSGGAIGPSEVKVTTDLLSHGFSGWANQTPAAWTCSASGGVISCVYAGAIVPSGALPLLQITAKTPPTTGTYQLCGQVHYLAGTDPAPGNDSSCVSVQVVP